MMFQYVDEDCCGTPFLGNGWWFQANSSKTTSVVSIRPETWTLFTRTPPRSIQNSGVCSSGRFVSSVTAGTFVDLRSADIAPSVRTSNGRVKRTPVVDNLPGFGLLTASPPPPPP